MQTTIYGIKNCSTMKKAFDKLNDMGITYDFFDYKKQALDKTTLSGWVEQLTLDKVMNTKGTTWRQLSADQKAAAKANENVAIALMLAQPSLIKRPIVEQNATLLLGFNERAFEKLSTE